MISKKNHHIHEFDPDWEAAQKHGQASRVGLIDPRVSYGNIDHVCKCCGQHYVKQPANLWDHSKQLQFLGFGIPLFYEFLKYCIILLIINIGTYNALSLQQAVADNYQFCHPKVGASSVASETNSNSTISQNYGGGLEVAYKCYTFLIELARIDQIYYAEEQTIRCVSFAIHLLVLIYIRNMITKLQAYYDERSTTLSDFSILIKDIDLPNGKVRKNTLEFFEKQFENPPRPAQVIVCPQYAEIQELRQKRQHLLNKMRPYYSGKELKQQQNQKLITLKAEVQKINEQIISQANKKFDQIKNDSLPCERVIVVFETQGQKQQVLNLFRSKGKSVLQKYFGSFLTLRISEAPNPQQIIWQHFSIPKKKRILHIIYGWALSVVLLVVIFIVFYFSLVAKSTNLDKAAQDLAQNPNDQAARDHYNGYVALVFILMFLVVLFDKMVLATLFHLFSQWELHSTTARLQFSFALKLSLGLFFTTALMTLAVQAIKAQNYYTHPYGVVDEQSIMFFMNAFFVPFFWLVNPLRLIRRLKRWWYKGKKNLTQFEANQLMEQQPYNVGKRFAEIIQTMWFVFLYCTLLPVGAIISVGGLALYYWVDKFNLLRRSKMQGKVSGSFIQTGLFLLDLTLLLRHIGAIIFDLHLREKAYQTSNIVLLCVAFVYIIFPKHYFIKMFNAEFFRPQVKTYSQAKALFKHNYNTHHPLFCILNEEQVQQQRTLTRLNTINSVYNNNFDFNNITPKIINDSQLQTSTALLKPNQ